MKKYSQEVFSRFLALLPTAEPAKPAQKKRSAGDLASSPNKDEQGGRGVDQCYPIFEDNHLFLGDDGNSYIVLDDAPCLLDTKNKYLAEEIRFRCRETTGKTPSKEAATGVIELLAAKARRSGVKNELFTKVGERNGFFLFYKGDGKVIETCPGKWRITSAPFVLRRMSHQLPQPDPVHGGDPWRFFEFCNIPQESLLLAMVTLVTCFVPRIAHPAIQITGCQGSGKSFFAGLWKRLLDPSQVILSSMPRKPDDLDLLLFRYYCLVLDNLSALSAEVCDRLCSFISGGVIEKRTLHTDIDTTILKANSVIIYNSITSLHNRPDLTERTVCLNLQRIPSDKRRPERKMLQDFDGAVPEILGGIFDLLAKAMEIFPTVELEELPRMADFALWGFAVAEAMGGRGDEFIRDYMDNVGKQNSDLLENNTLFAAIVQAIDGPEPVPLEGTFKEVLGVLAEIAAPGEEKTGYRSLEKDHSFPSARGLRKHLERIRVQLEEQGITFDIETRRTNSGKVWVTFSKDGHPLKNGVPF